MKRFVAVVLSVALICAFVPAAGAANDKMKNAAQALYDLGLFQGVGNNTDGTPDFALDRVPTRAEAVTMLVRLLGKDAEAKAGTWETPFTDVAEWAKPYVGYAYANGLTTGTGATTFGGEATVNATQYLTFVLRALGYTSGTDFQWDSAWTKSDEIKLTNGEYNANTTSFTRGDVAKISENALYIKGKGEGKTLGEKMGKFEVLELTPENLKGVWKRWKTGIWTGNEELIFDGNTCAQVFQGQEVQNSWTAPQSETKYKTGEFTIENESIVWECDTYIEKDGEYSFWSAQESNTVNYSDNTLIARLSDGTQILRFYDAQNSYKKAKTSELLAEGLKVVEGYKAENPSVEIIFGNTSDDPVVAEAVTTVYQKNYYGEIDSTWKISNFHYDYYVSYDKTCTATIYISGEWLKKGIGGNASGTKSCDLEWQLYDENEEYVIDSGTIYSPKVHVGEKFKDASDVIFNLPAGTYVIRFSLV